MGLTILSIPFIALGVFLKPYVLENSRCIGFFGLGPYCFEQASSMPEVIKYGSVAVGFALHYAGRLQIKRQRGREQIFVMPGLVPGIHVLLSTLRKRRRGWPGRARP